MKKVHLLLFAVILVLASCGNKSENKITHLPYQVEKDGRWGLIDWEGNPLIEEEFENTPSVVINGHFCVKNSSGLYEIYTAEKKPKQIGEEYLHVGHFSNGLAPVVKKDSYISYINTKGEEVFTLTKYWNTPIIQAWSFGDDGLAMIETSNEQFGYINTKGEFVIPPIYHYINRGSNGIYLAKVSDKKYLYINKKGETIIEPQCDNAWPFDKSGYAIIEKDSIESLIDERGKEIFKLKKGMKMTHYPSENLIAYSEGKKSIGYLNMKGEKEIKLSNKFRSITGFYNGFAIFNIDGKYGLIDKKGEIAVRGKYDELKMIGDEFLLYKDNSEWGFLSYQGDVIKRACYKEIIDFFEDEEYTYAKDGNTWILINKNGEEVKKDKGNTPNEFYRIYNPSDEDGYITNLGYSSSIVSDYLDIDAEVKNIMSVLNEDGTIDKMTFNMTPEEFANVYNKDYKVRDLLDKDNVRTFLKSLKYANIEIGITYYDNIIVPNYERKWVSNRWGGYYDNVISGYSYNSNLESGTLFCEYKLKGKLLERKQDVFNVILKYCNNKGYRGDRAYDSKTGKEFYWYEKEKTRLLIEFISDDVLQIYSVLKKDY